MGARSQTTSYQPISRRGPCLTVQVSSLPDRTPSRRAGTAGEERAEGSDGERSLTSGLETALAVARTHGSRERDVGRYALYLLAAQTGLRRGELLGLRWRGVDLERALVTVVQQLARRMQGNGERLGFGGPKTERGRRTINLSPESVITLKAVRDAQRCPRETLGSAYKIDSDLVFCRDDGNRHDPDVVSKRFAREVRQLHFHGLRHTSAVIGLRELGEWPDETSARLGHASVAFTLETYGDLVPRRGQSIALAFDQLLEKRRGDSM